MGVIIWGHGTIPLGHLHIKNTYTCACSEDRKVLVCVQVSIPASVDPTGGRILLRARVGIVIARRAGENEAECGWHVCPPTHPCLFIMNVMNNMYSVYIVNCEWTWPYASVGWGSPPLSQSTAEHAIRHLLRSFGMCCLKVWVQLT